MSVDGSSGLADPNQGANATPFLPLTPSLTIRDEPTPAPLLGAQARPQAPGIVETKSGNAPLSADDQMSGPANHDDCDVCGQGGDLLCCDGCPLSIHFGCLEPPTTQEEFLRDHGDDKWFCNSCKAKQKKAATRGKRRSSVKNAKSAARSDETERSMAPSSGSTPGPKERPKRNAAKRKRDDDAFEDEDGEEIAPTPTKRTRRESKLKKAPSTAEGGEEEESDGMDIEIKAESPTLITIEPGDMATDEGSSMDDWLNKRDWIIRTDFRKAVKTPKGRSKVKQAKVLKRGRGRPRGSGRKEDDDGDFGEELYDDAEELPTTKKRRSEENEETALPRTQTQSGRRIQPKNYREAFEDEDEHDSDVLSWESGEEGDVGEGESEESDEGEEISATTPWVPKEKVLEKILCHRDRNKALVHKAHFQQTADAPPPVVPSAPDYEFLIKWKDRSYIHCEWVSSDFIKANVHFGSARLERYWKGHPLEDPEEPFNPEFAVVDRILAEGKIDNQTYFFVKWQGLQYSESTWESANDINDDFQIQQFRARNEMPPLSAFTIPPKPPPESFVPIANREFKNGNELRSYQLEWYNNTNTILADEMGLGKTVQSVMLLNHLFTTERIRGPFLIVVPLSTIHHWQREIEAWTDMNSVIFHGNGRSRDLIREVEWTYGNDPDGHLKWNVLLTTYEMLLQEAALFESIEWQYVIIDEAHRLKNKGSRLTKELERMTYKHITLLTGTPIQNNMQELFTLLHILDEKTFPQWSTFEAKFGNLKEVSQVKELQLILKRYLLRRMKEDVEKSIAAKEETIIEVELTSVQKKYYRAILERNFDNLVRGGKANNLPSLMNIMMQLRKCCNHPYLLAGVEELELASRTDWTPEAIHANLIAASGKLVLIDKLLPRLRQEGHKVLIFSQMVHVLDLLEDYLNYRGYSHQRIDGHVRGNDRQRAIDRFCDKNADSFVFLLCTRAGGVGINLTAADTVIIFDSDWNPQNDLQAQARCHRIGQDKKVKIYRLITRNTYEREMFDRASMKLGLDHAVLTQLSDAAQSGDKSFLDKGSEERRKLTSKEVDRLLKKGVYSLMHEDDSQFKKFSEQNIDQILEERTQVIVHKGPGEGGPTSTFSKVSFETSTNEPQLDVNDPDFWRKALPGQSAPEPKQAVVEPRSRKQTKRFVFDDPDAEHLSDDGSSDEPSFRGAASRDDDAVVKSDDEPESFSVDDDDGGEYGARKRWGSRTLTTFLKSFLLFGYGRWDEIRAHSGVSMSIEDMEAFSTAFIKKVCAYLGKDADETLAQLREAHPQSTPPPPAPQDADAMDIDGPTPPPAAAPRLNPEYEAALNNPVFQTHLKRTGRIEYKRLILLAYLAKLVTSGELPPMPTFKAASEFPAEWGETENRDLLKGIYKHGFGCFHEIVADPELCFHGKYRLKDVRGPGIALPSFKLLTAHAKKLLSSLRNPDYKPQGAPRVKGAKREKKEKGKKSEKASEGGSEEASQSSAGATPKKASTKASEQRREAWFKNEYAVFYKLVTSFGLPLRKLKKEEAEAENASEGEWAYDFEWIKARGKLTRKSRDQIRAKYAELVNMSRKVVAYHAKGLLEAKRHELSLTYIQSNRLLDRIALFAVIRRRMLPLSDDQLDKYLSDLRSNANLQRWKAQLPAWWTAPHHDRAFMRAVIKHGFGNWEVILSDPEFPFAAILHERLKERNMPLPQVRAPEKKETDGENGDEENDGDDMEDEEEHEGEGEEEEEEEEVEGKPKKLGYHKQAPYAELMQMPRDQVIYRRLTFAVKTAVEAAARDVEAAPGSRARNKAFEEALKVGEIEDFVDRRIEENLESEPVATTLGVMGPPKKRTAAKELDIQRNEAGEIVFPIEIDKSTRVLALGTIKPRPGFQSLNYIFPVGYKSEKDYTSALDPNKKVTYINEIVDGGDAPLFRVTPTDDPGRPVEATSASSAWKTLLDRINEKRQEFSKRTSISGPEFFGFSHPTIVELLQGLPGADAIPRFGKAARKDDKDDGSTMVTSKSTVGSLGSERMRALASDKMPEDSSDVATDEGDNADFEAEMQRAVTKGRYKPQHNNSADDSGGEDEEPVPSSTILDYFRAAPPPPSMFTNYGPPVDNYWDASDSNAMNSMWYDAYPPLDDPLSLQPLVPPMPAPMPSPTRRHPGLSYQQQHGPQQTQHAARHSPPQASSPQKVNLENEAYNLRTALMHVEPGSFQEAELMAQLDQVQNKLSAYYQ